MKRLHIIINGKVQGVGFRYLVYSAANSFKLTGWVKNNVDDSVELEVQGNSHEIELFIEKLKKGNGISKVKSLSTEETNCMENERSFRITY